LKYIVLYVYTYMQLQTELCYSLIIISQIYFWNITQHVSDSFSVHHQESGTVHTAIGICQAGYADCLLAGSGWTYTTCCVYSARLLMIDRETVRNL